MSKPTIRPIWTPDDAAAAARAASEHRAYSAVPADLLDDAEYLDYLDEQPVIVPPARWSRGSAAAGAPGMRPGRARAISRACVATAVAILVAVAYVLWVVAVPR